MSELYASFFPMFPRRTNFGLDLGTHSVKCAAVEVDRNRIRELSRYDLVPSRQTQTDKLDEGAVRARLASIVSDFQKKSSSLPRSAIVALQGADIYSQYFELPKLSSRELEVAVPAMARKHIPHSFDDVSVSWLPVPPLVPDEKKTAVFVVAARKEAVARVKARVEACGLEVQRLDVAPLAIVREYIRNHEAPKKEVALVHIGFEDTTLIVLRDRYPYYVRNLPIAMRHFIYAIQMGVQSSWADAERNTRATDVQQADGYVEPYLCRWLDEVTRTIEHFQQRYSAAGAHIERVVLSGGGALQAGLPQRLNERLQIAVVKDSWQHLRPEGQNGSSEAATYGVAVGLALED